MNARLGGRVGTFLQSLKPGIEWERVNWGIAGTPLLNLHPSIEHPRLEEGATLSSAWLRVEHQALRLLPESGGILFGIRITLHRLDNLARNRTAALRLAELLETMPQAIADYKGLAQARNPLVRQLRKPGGTEAP
ncbi:MAG TPA: hypothetical protein DCM86_01465 [Verrucomicrobiales bacterium]|nr:hypothetical protein [Verrucomicrobiales bacterium]